MGNRKIVSQQAVLEELVAIGFARVTDYLFVEDGALQVRSTDALSREQQAAIASVEKTSGGLKLKFYDKIKALELIGKHIGMFEGKSGGQVEENNLLDAILEATREEVDTHDLPEVQQAAAAGHDLVESAGAKNL